MAKITKIWHTIDLGTLQIASNAYATAKSQLKRARKTKKRDDWITAKQLYLGVLEKINIDTTVHMQMSEIYKNLKEYDLAEKHIQESLELKKNRPDFLKTDQSFFHMKLCEIYFLSKKYEKAVDELMEVNKFNRNTELVDLLLPVCLEVNEKKQMEIIKHFEKKNLSIFADLQRLIDEKIMNKPKFKNELPNSSEQIQSVLVFLKIFGGALEGSIKFECTENLLTTRRVLAYLIENKLVEEKPIHNHRVYSLTDEGKKKAKEIYDEFQDIKSRNDDLNLTHYSLSLHIDEQKSKAIRDKWERWEMEEIEGSDSAVLELFPTYEQEKTKSEDD